MKSLYDSERVTELKQRMSKLKPDSPRQWGTMNPAQAMAHCCGGLEWAVGDAVPPRMFIGRLIGWMVKSMVLRDDEPMRKNSPTSNDIVVKDNRDLNEERARLITLIDRFVAAGPKGCTTHPHSFFGPLTPNEWAVLMYKHVDHHLRQFGV